MPDQNANDELAGGGNDDDDNDYFFEDLVLHEEQMGSDQSDTDREAVKEGLLCYGYKLVGDNVDKNVKPSLQ